MNYIMTVMYGFENLTYLVIYEKLTLKYKLIIKLLTKLRLGHFIVIKE